MTKIIYRKINKWKHEKKKYIDFHGKLSEDAPDVVKVKFRLMADFIGDLDEIVSEMTKEGLKRLRKKDLKP
ncbi:hypothetical protein LCGC14_1732730 [marine sediment metagenome]|uniref:Uncharacterized protein n=1 Tax=marine sediment metagenome TaxID=412755 RepID=A0A0F9H924_9ZZZZ